MKDRVVLAYSGGLDTTVAISWIAKERNAEVVAVSIDQNKDEQILKNFLASHGIGDFALYYEKGRGVQDRITMPGIPLTFLLAPGGRVLYVFQGQGDWISVEAIDFFSDILKNG